MVSPRTASAVIVALAAFAAAGTGCQTLAGIDDKELDPALGTGGADASGDGGGAAGSEAGPDAPRDDADAGSDVSDAQVGVQPPSRPVGDAVASGSPHSLTFAVRRFYLGTVDPESDTIDLDAWRQFGFDYDGECTTKQQSEHDVSNTCRIPGGANAASLEDGHECRDNIAGHILSEVLSFADKSFEKKEHNGTWNATAPTIILQILDLDDGPDDPYAPGRLYVTAPKDGGMLWDGEDVLEVDVDSLVDGDLDTPKYELPDGYVRDNVWVSGDFKGEPLIVPMMVLKQIAPVPTETSIVAVPLDEDHIKAGIATFSGVLDTLAFEPFMRLGMLEATGCDEAATELGMSMFLPNRDLADDEDFVNAAEECGLMSIGMGLELKRVRPPQTAVVAPPPPSSCDAGPH